MDACVNPQNLPYAGRCFGQVKLELDSNDGVAMSHGGAHLAVSSLVCYSVYSVSHQDNVLLTTVHSGSGNSDENTFGSVYRLCFTATDNLLLVDRVRYRVQEVTLSGKHVRFIGKGVVGRASGVAANDKYIAVSSCEEEADTPIMLFDAVTGAHVRSFGDVRGYFSALRFTRDGSHIIALEKGSPLYSLEDRDRIAMFTIGGEFVKHFGGDFEHLTSIEDIEVDHVGNIIVSEGFGSHNILVYSPDGSTLLQKWGLAHGKSKGRNARMLATSRCSDLLYVLHQDEAVVVKWG